MDQPELAQLWLCVFVCTTTIGCALAPQFDPGGADVMIHRFETICNHRKHYEV
jgi:hypothetical protein